MLLVFTVSAENGEKRAVVTGAAAEEFGRLYEEYMPRVFRYVSYRVGGGHTAEDLTSDIFNKALGGFRKFDPGKASFSTWIFTIARNTLTDHYRKAERARNTGEPDERIRSEKPGPDEEISRAEEVRKLHECISRLAPNEQELISLKFGSEMTNREIAGFTGLSESNVGTILCRAVRKLRDDFAGWK